MVPPKPGEELRYTVTVSQLEGDSSGALLDPVSIRQQIFKSCGCQPTRQPLLSKKDVGVYESSQGNVYPGEWDVVIEIENGNGVEKKKTRFLVK